MIHCVLEVENKLSDDSTAADSAKAVWERDLVEKSQCRIYMRISELLLH